ncbi:MAG TPA: DegT/DnrJ/EryC1/StrS family aminotransferase [Chloroflexota bacterium]
MANQLAARGGTPVRTQPFPEPVVWDDRELQEVTEVIRSGQWGGGIGAVKNARLGELMARLHDARYGIPVSSGTAALEVALLALGVRPGDEVIVPAYTWIATPLSVLSVGAIAVFADVDPATFNMDPADAERKITPRTRAIMPVHWGGRPVDLDAYLELGRRHGIPILEDAAQAHGAKWRGRGIGSWGAAGCFSFQQSKTITAGEGGAVTTNDKATEERVVSYANCGRIRPTDQHLKENPVGHNYRLSDLQAAVLLAQLSRLDELADRRAQNADHLDRELGKIEGISARPADERITRSAYYLYLFRYDPAGFGGLSRDAFAEALQAEGIPVFPGAGSLVYRSPLFNVNRENTAALRLAEKPVDYRQTRCPQAEQLAGQALYMPHRVLMGGEAECEDVVRAVRKIQANVRELQPVGVV